MKYSKILAMALLLGCSGSLLFGAADIKSAKEAITSMKKYDEANALMAEVVTKQKMEIVSLNKKVEDLLNESKNKVGLSKDDLNKIGKFGAGFKSVFAITNTPRIYSGDLSFEIQDYIVPQTISKIELEENLTAIELLFNSQKINSERAYQVISDKLLKLESESLLFLKNIQKIQWSFLEKNGSFNKVKKKSKNCEYIDIIINNNESTKTKSYLKIDRTIQLHNKNLTLSIAYALENNQIIPIENSLLSVFFPTKVNTYYKFLLQAPYKTTPNRENIPFEDEDNQVITKELSKLVGESFLILKQIILL